MKKKYTLQIVKFQIKTYYNKAFQLLKFNHYFSLNDNSNYKRTLLRQFRGICNEERFKFHQKKEVLFFFSRIIKLKCVYKIIKLQLANKKQHKRLRCHFLRYQLKSFYHQFTAKATVLSERNNLYIQYNIFFVKRMYITFFKSVCKYISSKSKRMKKYNDATELYLFKLSIKALKKLKENVLLMQSSQGKQLRKKLLMRVFYKNLQSSVYEYNQRCNYYRCLHLKKYHFNRLARTIKAIGNHRIANLKFISKWMMLWKELILKHKRTRAEGIVLLSRVLDKIKIKYIVKGLRMFYIRLKEKNRSILKMKINEIKCSKFIQMQINRMKMNLFQELKYNLIINKCSKRREIILIKSVFQVLKFIKDISIPMYLKEEEAMNHYKNKAYKKIVKPYVTILKKNINVNKAKVQFFRITMRKIKIVKLLKVFKSKSQKENNRRETRFRRYFLLYNYMNMMKKHSLIMYRENKILSGIKKKIAKDRLSYMKWGFRSIRNNLIVKRYKRRKMFKLIIQVFTALKMMSIQNGYRFSDTSNDNDFDDDGNNEFDYNN